MLIVSFLLTMIVTLTTIAPLWADTPAVTDAKEEDSVVDVCKSREFFSSRAEGWFWYNDCLKRLSKKQPRYKTVPDKVSIPWDIIDRLDPSEIARLEEESRKIALMYPTEKNISEYRKLLTFIMGKVYEFTRADLLYRTKDSGYAALAPYVGSDFRTEQWRSIKREKRREILERFKERAGLIVVFREGCPFCEKQKVPVEAFQRDYKWKVKWVNADEHPDFTKNVGTEVVPDILLVLNRNGRPVIDRVASGLTTKGEIEDGIFYSLYRLGEVKDEDIVFE